MCVPLSPGLSLDSHTGVTVPGFISPQADNDPIVSADMRHFPSLGLLYIYMVRCKRCKICLFVILYLIFLCLGRGSPTDAALVSLHQILLQKSWRLAEAEERPRQHHDQRHGQDRGDGQGVQPHLLKRKKIVIRENWKL